VVAQLEGPLEMVDSLSGTASRATHEAEARTLVHPSMKETMPSLYLLHVLVRKHTHTNYFYFNMYFVAVVKTDMIIIYKTQQA
jgi:hypothetical protein